MPLLVSFQSPTGLSAGERVAVLNAEGIVAGGITMAVSFKPEPQDVLLCIYNNTSSTMQLVASPNLVAANFLPVYGIANTLVLALAGSCYTTEIGPSLYYALQATTTVVTGTAYLAR